MKKVLVYLLVGISVFLISCSGKTDKDIYESAIENITNEKYAESLAQFEVIVAEYPNSEYYKNAILQTGELYQGNVNKDMSFEESQKNAINSYRLFQSKY